MFCHLTSLVFFVFHPNMTYIFVRRRKIPPNVDEKPLNNFDSFSCFFSATSHSQRFERMISSTTMIQHVIVRWYFWKWEHQQLWRKEKSTRCYQNRRKPGWEKLKENSSTLGTEMRWPHTSCRNFPTSRFCNNLLLLTLCLCLFLSTTKRES